MQKLVRIVLSVISAAALLILVGWGVLQLGRIYLNAIAQSPVKPATSQSAGNRQTLQLQGFDVWYLQLGTFDNQTNAEKLVLQLKAKGIDAVVLRGKPYRVAACYLGQKGAARDARLMLALKGLKPLEKQQTVNGISGTIAAGDGIQVKVILVNYGQILADVAQSFKVEDPSQLKVQDVNNLCSEISELRQATVDSVQKLASTSNRMIVKEMSLALDQQGQQLIQDLQGLNKQKNRQNYSKAQYHTLQLLNTYWQYIDLLQEKSN